MKRKIISLLVILIIFNFKLFSQKIVNVKASSEKANNLAVFAVDKNLLTRWESEWQDNQWIEFEFDKIYTLYGMRIVWERASAFKYKILSSIDDINWQEVVYITDGLEGEDRKMNFLNPVKSKYIKIECLERATGWGFSIFEVEFKKDSKYSEKEIKTFKSEVVKGEKFFSVTKKDNKYWFVSPDEKLFISKGVNVVIPTDGSAKPNSEYYNVLNKYKSKEDWAEKTIKRLKKWGFNTIGCWSDYVFTKYDMPFVIILNVPVPGSEHRLVDVFNKKFPEIADKVAKINCSKFKDSKYLLGYFIDNELPWYGDVGWYTGHAPYLLDEYMKLSSDADGKIFLKQFFEKKYKTVKNFNKVWAPEIKSFEQILKLESLEEIEDEANSDREEFCSIVAEMYFKTITESIRRYDPNHLILGVRFAGSAPDEVLKVCGKYCDVVSVNYYSKSMILSKDDFNKIYVLSGEKPVLITEFSYRAMENNSKNKNTKGADVTVPTQNDRALGYEKYVTQAMEFPYIIGYHWFQYFDQSPQGRSFDGEDSNYGLVDIYDNEYETLLKKVTEINSKSETLHQRSQMLNFSFKSTIEEYAKVENAEIKRKLNESFVDFDKVYKNYIAVWGDFGNNASISFDIEKKKKSVLKININSLGWGCGITIPTTLSPFNSDQSTDLQGYKGIKIKLNAPKNVKFQIFINESGVDAPYSSLYNAVRGADGESFASKIVRGNGELKEYKFDFTNFRCRTEWGNQTGNKTINLQAIKTVDIFFLPKSTGEIIVEEIKLY